MGWVIVVLLVFLIVSGPDQTVIEASLRFRRSLSTGPVVVHKNEGIRVATMTIRKMLDADYGPQLPEDDPIPPPEEEDCAGIPCPDDVCDDPDCICMTLNLPDGVDPYCIHEDDEISYDDGGSSDGENDG